LTYQKPTAYPKDFNINYSGYKHIDHHILGIKAIWIYCFIIKLYKKIATMKKIIWKERKFENDLKELDGSGVLWWPLKLFIEFKHSRRLLCNLTQNCLIEWWISKYHPDWAMSIIPVNIRLSHPWCWRRPKREHLSWHHSNWKKLL